jgi:DNA-binding transcriptional MerR regulator
VVEAPILDKDEYKIGEVCDIAGVKPFVLRYWETEFPELAPSKGAGGQRTYTRDDVQLILRIKQLLYEERFTVAGAKKRLAEESGKPVADPPARLDTAPPDKVERLNRVLDDVRQEIENVVKLLR